MRPPTADNGTSVSLRCPTCGRRHPAFSDAHGGCPTQNAGRYEYDHCLRCGCLVRLVISPHPCGGEYIQTVRGVGPMPADDRITVLPLTGGDFAVMRNHGEPGA